MKAAIPVSHDHGEEVYQSIAKLEEIEQEIDSINPQTLTQNLIQKKRELEKEFSIIGRLLNKTAMLVRAFYSFSSRT